MPVAQRQLNPFFYKYNRPEPAIKYSKLKFPTKKINKLSQYPIDIDDEPRLDGLLVPENVYWELYYEDTLYEWNKRLKKEKPKLKEKELMKKKRTLKLKEKELMKKKRMLKLKELKS